MEDSAVIRPSIPVDKEVPNVITSFTDKYYHVLGVLLLELANSGNP
jgi:hypothetical protein